MQGGLAVQSLETTRPSPAEALLLPGVSTAAEAARTTLQMKKQHLRTFRYFHLATTCGVPGAMNGARPALLEGPA